MRLILATTLAFAIAGASAAQPSDTTRGQPLPTNQVITPTAMPGAKFEPLVAHVGPHPDYVVDGAAAIAVSPHGGEMLVLTSGYNRYVGPDDKLEPAQSGQYVFRYRIDAKGSRLLQSLTLPNSYSGIAWRPDGHGFIVGGGVDDVVRVYSEAQGMFKESATIALGHAAGNGIDVKPQAAGVAVSPDGRHALVANYYNDSVSLLDLDTRKVIAERDLRPGKIDPAQSGQPGGEFPFAVAWSDASHAFVSAPRDRQVIALSLGSNVLKVDARVATIGEPTAMLFDKRRRRLHVVEDNADRLAVIDAETCKLVMEPRLTLPVALAAPPLGKGLNPNGLALLPDGRLLVTLGGINAVALVEIERRDIEVVGLMPTGWYPSAVVGDRGGKRVFVVNRKSPPGPNPQGCDPKFAIYQSKPDACGKANQYVFQLEKSGLLQFPMPDARALARATLQVAANIGLPNAAARTRASRFMAKLRKRIKHVVFIIKENRTYDQVLGDLEKGDGDPRLAILGEAYTPNHHQLARRFVTLDNFLNSGEQSSTGWTWSTAARVPDLLEKNAPVNYAGRGLAYEAEQADRSIYTQLAPAQRKMANPKMPDDPDLLPGPALLTAPDADDDDLPGQGFLWSAAIRKGLSVRNYGFADASVYDSGAPGAIPVVREPFKDGVRIYTPGDPLLANRSDPYYRGFDQKLPDYWRFLEWQREFDIADAAGKVPALTLLRLSHDHFGDFAEAVDGVNTVETEMADNDYALGLVLERLSRSRVADSTLVFVIEDDAQDGADHVDARRSIAFVAGAHVRKEALVSTRYTTINVLRTIGEVLGLKPLGLNDGLAMPMADLFDLEQSPQWTFQAQAADVLRTTRLPIPEDRFVAKRGKLSSCTGRDARWWAQAMRGQDFSKEDRLDSRAFNRALWEGLGNGAEPLARGGENLREHREVLLAKAASATRCP